MAERLDQLHSAIAAVVAAHGPDRAAAEEVFVNKNPQSTLKLAQARGAVLAACGAANLVVNEHAARLVKSLLSAQAVRTRFRSRPCSKCCCQERRSQVLTRLMRSRWRLPMRILRHADLSYMQWLM